MAEDKKYDSVSNLLRKKAEKKAAAIERKEEREATGNVNKLIIERDSSGLYYCRYSFSGLLSITLGYSGNGRKE